MNPVPTDQRFYLRDTQALAAEIQRIGAALTVASDEGILAQPLSLGPHTVPNRFCAQPLESADAAADGTPSPLARRRYEQLAGGGFGLIWIAAAVHPDARHPPDPLCLNADNTSAFASLVDAIRHAARQGGHPPPLLILQLDPTPPPPLDPGSLLHYYQTAATAAAHAGFEGIAIRGDAARLLHAARANGTPAAHPPHLLPDILDAIHTAHPHLLLAVRFCAFTASHGPGSFGTLPSDYRQPDLTDPIHVARHLRNHGVTLLNITTHHPNLRDTPAYAARHPLPPDAFPHAHPLSALAQRMQILKTLRTAVPGVAFAGDGFSWLRHLMPPVAAGLLRDGNTDLIGLGRFALAYPEAPAHWQHRRTLDPGRCCIQCGACTWLQHNGAPVGCVLHDSTVYGPVYRQRQRFAPDRLQAEARRCHQCTPAPCVQSTPGAMDIPAMLRACANGDFARAGRQLRRARLLAGMCAQLAPFSASGESTCIERTFSDRPIAIRDLQIAAAAACRAQGGYVLQLPAAPTGRHIAVIGAGPAGIAATAILLEHGHAVTLFEAADRPGGIPERLIPTPRYTGAHAEISALLDPARQAGRLTLRLHTALGRNLTLEAARRHTNAILLTTGIWQEQSLGQAVGVFSGPAFLEQAKSGKLTSTPGRAALLCGGDCAMDAACVLKAIGAEPLFLLFAGSRAQMHWCMEEDWFKQPGVHALMLTQPLGYTCNAGGQVNGVRVSRMQISAGGEPRPATDNGAYTLTVDTVIEAMGLSADASLRQALPGITFTDDGLLRRPDPESYRTGCDSVYAAGALINGGASVAQCVHEGMQAAMEIHHGLGL